MFENSAFQLSDSQVVIQAEMMITKIHSIFLETEHFLYKYIFLENLANCFFKKCLRTKHEWKLQFFFIFRFQYKDDYEYLVIIGSQSYKKLKRFLPKVWNGVHRLNKLRKIEIHHDTVHWQPKKHVNIWELNVSSNFLSIIYSLPRKQWL